MRIIYKLPSRHRPEKLFAAIDNIRAMAQHDDYCIYPTLDDSDHSYSEIDRRTLKEVFLKTVSPIWGRSISKIHAVNRDMPTDDWDIVVATSDDMEFIEPGFDLKIIAYFEQHFPDTDGVIHVTDGYAHGDILSLPIIGRKYYDRFGYIYHPSYQSLYCDEEAIIVARALGKCLSAPDKIVKHKHPMNDTTVSTDALYKHNDKFYHIDKTTFEKRQRANFFIK
jgi:hypothetical protein